jgi:hypothetical protein
VPWKHRISVFAAALWWGSLGAIGFLAVPLLFANAPSASIAGQLAARLFPPSRGWAWPAACCC